MSTLPPPPSQRVSVSASVARDHALPFRAPAILGQSPAFVHCRRLIGRLAPLSLPVLIRGETGTGKELAARLLHDDAPRASAPFVALNCAAIPTPLAESELFGHARGAFTGAVREHAGAFIRADGGTLFLDEVAELPLSVQAKLLRVLELSVVSPVGGEHERPVLARVVAATHRDLDAMVRAGEFREDLFFRLGVLTVDLPPLRERQQDIALLLSHFVEQASHTLGRPVTVTPGAVEAAGRHAWPGNIRGLRNAVLRAAVLNDGTVTAEALLPRTQAPATRPTHDQVVVPRSDYHSMNRAMLEQVVAAEGSIRRAAEVLEIPRSTLGAWLKRSRTA